MVKQGCSPFPCPPPWWIDSRHIWGAFEPADTNRKGLRGQEEVLEKSNTWPAQVLESFNSHGRALLEFCSNITQSTSEKKKRSLCPCAPPLAKPIDDRSRATDTLCKYRSAILTLCARRSHFHTPTATHTQHTHTKISANDQRHNSAAASRAVPVRDRIYRVHAHAGFTCPPARTRSIRQKTARRTAHAAQWLSAGPGDHPERAIGACADPETATGDGDGRASASASASACGPLRSTQPRSRRSQTRRPHCSDDRLRLGDRGRGRRRSRHESWGGHRPPLESGT